MRFTKLTSKLLLVISLNIFWSCSHSISTPSVENTERSISSIGENENCTELLNKFLPDEYRTRSKLKEIPSEEMSAALKPAAQVELSPKMKELEKAVEKDAADLFNTFQKDAKDSATHGKFKLLVDPHESLMARIMLIRNAKKSIDLTYYIFQDSETSKLLISELREAVRRGVNVRLMIDGSGSIAASTNFFKEIQILTHTVGGKIYDNAGNVIGNAKFEAIEINPMYNVRATIKSWYSKIHKIITGKELPNNDFSIFHRSHDKILLVDATSPEDSMAIVGGRNISNHYYKIGTEEERDNTFNDLDILVKHIAFTESNDGVEVIRNVLLEHFNRLYYYSANKKFSEFIFKLGRGNLSSKLNEIRKTRNSLIRKDGEELTTLLTKMQEEDFLNNGFDHGYISFLDEIENLVRKNSLKNLSYDNNPNSIIKNLWSQIEKAEKDILICSPYIYLTDKEIAFLTNWLKDNPERTLRLITNSSATSDNLFAQSMVENFVMPKLLKSFKENGINEKQFEILAYGNLDNKEFGGTVSQGKLHAKFWLVDNYVMGVGTSNFDPISRLTNSEIVANVFPTEGFKSIDSMNKYYSTLKVNSTRWNSDDFYKAKFRPELKKKLMIQSFIAKILDMFKILPQN